MFIKRMNGIAFVQIVSALLIVNYHTSRLGIPYLCRISRFGLLFNTIFVFLSGYLLARSLSATPAPSYKEFLYKRFNRIFPSFHVSLSVIALIYLWLGKHFTMNSFFLSATGLAYYFKDNTFGVHLWFISLILICYVLCIPIYHLIKKHPVVYLILLLILSSITVLICDKSLDGIYGKVSSTVRYRFLCHFIAFSVALYYGMQKAAVIALKNQWKWIGIFIVLFPLCLWLQPQPGLGVFAIVAVLLVAICLINIILNIYPLVEKHFSSLFVLSAVTYEIYLIHYSVIDAVDHNYHGEYFAYPLVFLATISLAYLIYLISKSYERLTRRITGWLLH